MREGKYVDEVYKWVKELPDDDKFPHQHLLLIADKVAEDHPVWYERFRIRGLFVRAWRKVMGDARNVLNFLSEEQKRKRFNRAVEVVFAIVLLVTSLGLLGLALWLTNL